MVTELRFSITAEQLQTAFDIAEVETAHKFDHQMCGMRDKEGKIMCPICFFRIKVQEYLGIWGASARFESLCVGIREGVKADHKAVVSKTDKNAVQTDKVGCPDG